MPKRTETALGLLLLAGACTPVEMRGDSPHLCSDGPAQRYVGGDGGAGAIEGARKASGARSVRVVRPGEMTTMDFRADRLTVTVDGHGRIGQARCG